jgi:AraC family ethanolamine operon transcriptional activator
VLKPPPQAIRRFANLVRRFLAAAEARPLLLEAPYAVDSFREELLAVIRELFTRLQPAANRHFVRWQGYAKATVEFATRQPELTWSIAELAQQNGVPERTLRTAFQRCYGLSPVEYLRIYRLHQARGLLRVGRPDETTVTQIAYALGFWELGRFARDYRRLFQELPSETLKRAGR